MGSSWGGLGASWERPGVVLGRLVAVGRLWEPILFDFGSHLGSQTDQNQSQIDVVAGLANMSFLPQNIAFFRFFFGFRTLAKQQKSIPKSIS